MTSKSIKYVGGKLKGIAINKALGFADKAMTPGKDRLIKSDVILDIDGAEVFSAKDNLAWCAFKIKSMTGDIKKFIDGEMPRSEFMDSMLSHSSEAVSKIVGTLVKGTIYSSAALTGTPLPPKVVEGLSILSGIVASEIFCVAFKPLISLQRNREAQARYEELHAVYETSLTQIRRDREAFREQISIVFERREALIDQMFAALENGADDVDNISRLLDDVSREISGKGLTFGSRAEFEDFILNSNEELVL